MKNIFCIGETVLDIIFRDKVPIGAKPGGSMLNTSVSLGRAGLQPILISDFGQDSAGDLIHDALRENGVDILYVDRFTEGKTAISLAFLDENGNATYTFYRQFPDKRLTIRLPEAKKGDIVLFGSFYSIDHDVHKPLWKFLLKAKKNGAFLLYDPNFRKPHIKQLPQFSPWIMENISLAEITRGSAEDFLHIFDVPDAVSAYKEIIDHGGNTLIYTKSKEGVEVLTDELHLHFPSPEIAPVSTIGAGDAFNAGLIYSLCHLPGETRIPASKQVWKKIITTAVEFSTNVCLNVDNYISTNFLQKLDDA